MEQTLIAIKIKFFPNKQAIATAVLYALAITTLGLLMMAAINPVTRNKIRSQFQNEDRQILAVTQADLMGRGKFFDILKVKTHEGIFLEVYGANETSDFQYQKLLSRIKLPDSRDGYFTFNGIVTNLAVDDIDNDLQPEILATTFDDDLVPHLNVYRFETEQKELELVQLTD